jgi:hypothetical protein
MAAGFEPTPLRRPQTGAERRHINEIERELAERVALLRDTRSGDGIHADVLAKWARINPGQRGK